MQTGAAVLSPHHTSAASADTAMMTFTALMSMIAFARV
jgi:hypothetical protein